MKELDLNDISRFQRVTLLQSREGTGLPKGMKLIRLLGKGSNNAVYLAETREGANVIVRQPRRNSDTQRIGNASWEFRNTAIAAKLQVAPKIYDAWYVRHATKFQRSGLHIICDYYSQDVHSLLIDTPKKVIGITKILRDKSTMHLKTMAENCLINYDLKPSNMVFSEDEYGNIDVRFIDFGRDFCEWRPYSETNEYLERAPVLSFIQNVAEEYASDSVTACDLYKKLIYITMVVMLSANISYTLDQSRHAMRASFAERAILNFMAHASSELRSCTRGKHVSLIKMILRHRDIKETMRHYMGRRNCGTKRVFQYAGFRKMIYE